MDAATPAVTAGLRLGASRGKVFRAFLEGESYEMMVNIECLKAMGIDDKKVITVGGGSNSPLWMQVRADIFNVPVCLPAVKEAGTFASALLSLVGVGRYPSVREAQKALIRYEETYVPDARRPVQQTVFAMNMQMHKILQICLLHTSLFSIISETGFFSSPLRKSICIPCPPRL